MISCGNVGRIGLIGGRQAKETGEWEFTEAEPTFIVSRRSALVLWNGVGIAHIIAAGWGVPTAFRIHSNNTGHNRLTLPITDARANGVVMFQKDNSRFIERRPRGPKSLDYL